MPLLREVLIKCKRGESEFVFPEQAAMVEQNPDDITNRVQRVFEKAGFKDIVDEDKVEVNGGSENGQKAEGKPSKSISATCGWTHNERKVGLRRATIRGFHSFERPGLPLLYPTMCRCRRPNGYRPVKPWK